MQISSVILWGYYSLTDECREDIEMAVWHYNETLVEVDFLNGTKASGYLKIFTGCDSNDIFPGSKVDISDGSRILHSDLIYGIKIRKIPPNTAMKLRDYTADKVDNVL